MSLALPLHRMCRQREVLKLWGLKPSYPSRSPTNQPGERSHTATTSKNSRRDAQLSKAQLMSNKRVTTILHVLGLQNTLLKMMKQYVTAFCSVLQLTHVLCLLMKKLSWITKKLLHKYNLTLLNNISRSTQSLIIFV